MSYDRTKHREYMRKWYANNRAAFFADKSCVDCGSTTSLELDHIDPDQKVSHRIWSWSKERREAEIAKCQVLCSDCHLTKTKADRAAKIICGKVTKYRQGCRCELCKAAKAEEKRRYLERQKIAA